MTPHDISLFPVFHWKKNENPAALWKNHNPLRDLHVLLAVMLQKCGLGGAAKKSIEWLTQNLKTIWQWVKTLYPW
jgi:hypothetical protein